MYAVLWKNGGKQRQPDNLFAFFSFWWNIQNARFNMEWLEKKTRKANVEKRSVNITLLITICNGGGSCGGCWDG